MRGGSDSYAGLAATGQSRKNIYVDPGRQLEVWPQFQKDADVELKYRFAVVYGEERRVFEFTEEQLKSPQIVDTKISNGHQYITMAVYVRGYGRLSLGNVEYRWTRYGLGTYLNGGQSLVDPKDEKKNWPITLILAILNRRYAYTLPAITPKKASKDIS